MCGPHIYVDMLTDKHNYLQDIQEMEKCFIVNYMWAGPMKYDFVMSHYFSPYHLPTTSIKKYAGI